MPTRAFIIGCEGTVLTTAERRLLADADPWGLILFTRNCVAPDQVRALTASFREIVGRADAPVLIDQEGGRVQRLRAPFSPAYPPAGRIGDIYARGSDAGLRAAWLAGRLIAEDLWALGITVNCLPVLDVRHPDGHGIIGDRAYSDDPQSVAMLGQATAAGLAAGGVAPVAKHLPGHGRAGVDSHEALPVVDTSRDRLAANDFLPFKALAHLPMAMTAHVVYTDLDPRRPATVSPRVVGDIIRGDIGFGGLLMSDDLSMQALEGPVEASAVSALEAGCDVALHCNGELAEMRAIAEAAPPLQGAAAARAGAALAWAERQEANIPALRTEFEQLLARAIGGTV